MPGPQSVHLFCRVIDNFGDIGVCWRLARQFHQEHGLKTTLWVDDLLSFRRLCPLIDPDQAEQSTAGVTVRQWRPDCFKGENASIPDLVIEAFGCELPHAYVQAMAQRVRSPVWINLEYLSAEKWVEGCHRLPSPHPSLSLKKYFFFPGFSAETGGLPLESDLWSQRSLFQADRKGRKGFLADLGIGSSEDAVLVSLFCYPSAPVLSLFSELAQSPRPVTCMVPESVAAEQVGRFMQQEARAGTSATQGQLTVNVIPFLPQSDYDKLLWSCDINFVRGEDSLVRAQWAGRPFIWQIYPQQDDAHWTKLDAFTAAYASGLPEPTSKILIRAWRAWNGAPGQEMRWQDLHGMLPELQVHTRHWAESLRSNGDLVSNLLRFAEKIG